MMATEMREFDIGLTTESSLSTSVSSLDVVQVLELIIGCLGIAGNTTCVIVLRRRSVRNHTNWLIVNQAVVDCLVSVLLVASVATKIAGVSPVDMSRTAAILFCKFWGSFWLVFAGFAISTFNLVALSVERYIAVVHPVWYLRHFKKRTMVIFIALVWLLAPILQIATVVTEYGVLENGECNFYAQNGELLVALFFWEYFFPIGIMTFSFIAILMKFRKLNRIAQDRSMELRIGAPPDNSPSVQTPANCQESQGPSTSSQNAPAENDAHTTRGAGETSTRDQVQSSSCREQRKSNDVGRIQRRNTTKVLFAVYVLYLICWSPNQWAFLQFNLGGHLDFNSSFYRYTVIMGTLNTCINPFLYALRLKIYQREMKNLMRLCRCTLH